MVQCANFLMDMKFLRNQGIEVMNYKPKQETRGIKELLQQTMRQSKFSNLFISFRNLIETERSVEPWNAI